jgi:hypothetical protein
MTKRPELTWYTDSPAWTMDTTAAVKAVAQAVRKGGAS